MNYVEHVNGLLKEEVAEADKLVLYGQNMVAGSCLGGMCRNLKVNKSSKIINTQNSENTLVGVGFGLMLNSVSSVFFMKQQDFLLLGIDHLVNTYNIIRVNRPNASFTIMPIIVDSGFEGPQSSLNSFSDFCSIAQIDGFSCTNKGDARKIIKKHLISPGFRIIGVSQRLFRQELLDLKVIKSHREGKYFQYEQGQDVTIACFNFSLPYGLTLVEKLSKIGVRASLFSINTYSEFDFSPILNDINKTKKLVVMDDSKSGNVLCDKFLYQALDQCEITKKIVLQKKLSTQWFYPNSDELKINYTDIVQELKS
jgi:pyruvate/2-oxoglutarate/acetoin dehydrogenase E1 component